MVEGVRIPRVDGVTQRLGKLVQLARPLMACWKCKGRNPIDAGRAIASYSSAQHTVTLLRHLGFATARAVLHRTSGQVPVAEVDLLDMLAHQRQHALSRTSGIVLQRAAPSQFTHKAGVPRS